MKTTIIIGVVLILIGAGILGYRQFSYKTRETVLEVGPLKATAERTKTVPFLQNLGWALVGGGACVVIFGSRPRD